VYRSEKLVLRRGELGVQQGRAGCAEEFCWEFRGRAECTGGRVGCARGESRVCRRAELDVHEHRAGCAQAESKVCRRGSLSRVVRESRIWVMLKMV
jgi:hypothetical protein